MLQPQWRRGDLSALDPLARMVNRELRRLAASELRRERPDHTLQTMAQDVRRAGAWLRMAVHQTTPMTP
jgi:hypothetical protein